MSFGPACGVLAVWFLLTVVFSTPLRRRKPFGRPFFYFLLPQWNFFAPRPGTFDFHFLIRHQRRDGTRSPWRESPLTSLQGGRGWRHALWNPRKRVSKALFDVASALRVEVPTADEMALLRLSVPYLTLLNAASAEPRTGEDVAVQFAVAERTATDGEIRVLFVSDTHPLEAEAGTVRAS